MTTTREDTMQEVSESQRAITAVRASAAAALFAGLVALPRQPPKAARPTRCSASIRYWSA
jgi:hypothetical protein